VAVVRQHLLLAGMRLHMCSCLLQVRHDSWQCACCCFCCQVCCLQCPCSSSASAMCTLPRQQGYIGLGHAVFASNMEGITCGMLPPAFCRRTQPLADIVMSGKFLGWCVSFRQPLCPAEEPCCSVKVAELCMWWGPGECLALQSVCMLVTAISAEQSSVSRAERN
jgi:hypothetical protein